MNKSYHPILMINISMLLNEEGIPHPPPEGGKDLFDDYGPLAEYYKFVDLFDDPPLEDADDLAAREGESQEATKAQKCLIKKKGKGRPECIDHSSWRNMSKRQRAEVVAEHERRIQATYEAEYQAAINAVPAMPVSKGSHEDHRERLLSLFRKKLLEVREGSLR